MPTYVYECPSCGEFEVQQPITEDALKACTCGQPIKRLIRGVRVLVHQTQTAAYWAGREGSERMQQQMDHNAYVAAGVKSGEYDNPRPGKTQPRELFNDLERRLKDA